MSEITFTTKSGEEITAMLIQQNEHFYAASSSGDIFRLTAKGPKQIRGRIMNRGYREIIIGGKHILVHRLICLAFHGEPPTNSHEVAHNDGDRLNNRPENLRWATRSANAYDRLKHGNDPSRLIQLRSIKPYVNAGFLPLHGNGKRTRKNSNRVAVWLALMALERAKVTAQ